MAGSRKRDSKTEAQRKFEELLRKTEAYLKKKASPGSKAGKQSEAPKKHRKDG